MQQEPFSKTKTLRSKPRRNLWPKTKTLRSKPEEVKTQDENPQE